MMNTASTCLRSSRVAVRALAPAQRSCLYHTSTVVEEQSKINKIYERMMWLDVVELNLLNSEIQKRLGMNLTFASSSPKSSSAAGEEATEVAEAKTTFDLKLLGYDPKSKIKVIKEVRSIAGLGLKEAKEMVEGAPKVIKKDLKEDEANELKAKLEELGAEIEVS